MICTRYELMEIVKRTVAEATPEEKQQLREALLESRSVWVRKPGLTKEDEIFLRSIGVLWSDKE